MSEIEVKGAVGTAGTIGRPANPLHEAYVQLDRAEQLRLQQKFDDAEKACADLVRRYPEYVAGLHTLGLIHADKSNFDKALDCLVRAAMLDPRNWKTLTALSGVYLRLRANEMAAETLERARQINPKDSSVLITLGEIYREEREYELAYQAFHEARALEPARAPAAFGVASTCVSLGRNAEAVELLERLVTNRSDFQSPLPPLAPLAMLANLPLSLVGIDVLAHLQHVTPDPSDDRTEFENSAAFVRASALDKAGRHGEAWEHLESANRNVFSALQKELPEIYFRQRLSLAWVRERLPKSAAPRSEGPVSLFILGPSRSGKTSMEKLVATLDGVKPGFENPIVENAIRRSFQTSGLITNAWFENLPSMLHSLCRDLYVEELVRRAGPAKVFTNTHPVRIHEAARLAQLFPNLRFLFVKRAVEDNALRIYMRKYQRGNAYGYDLKSIRDHITWYHEMIDLLAEKLPSIVRVIPYEDMVADPVGALRVAADLCGLPMNHGPLPEIGDDRGCAAPYRELMAALEN